MSLLLARPVVAPPQLALAHFGHLPLFFEPNFGQADKELRFLARGAACVLGLADRQAIIRLRPRHGRHSSLLRMHLVGAAQPAAIEGREPTGGVSSYFVGRTPEKWRTGIRQYASVEYRRIYPGIDLIFHARQGALEFDFQVTPGADPGLIRMRWEGVDSVKVGHAGELVLAAEAAELRLRRPRVFQQVGDRRVELEGRYVVRGAREVRFALARHDTTAPLLIDPVLSYSTFLGGSGDDFAARLAVDSTGNAYVTGQTSSLDFPVSSGAVDTSANGWNDVFVTKLNPTGAAVLYSTYLGGSGDDSGSGIAVDPAGNAYVVGRTDSPNFPVTAGAFDTSANGSYDAFVAKLNATGTALLYSTFLGGSAFDAAHAIALDAAGNAYVSGATLSSNFPTTAGAYDTSPNGRSDAFVAKLSAAGSSLVYSTLLGGAGDDVAQDIALDSSGNAYVTGSTSSSDFPTTVGAYDTSFNGGSFPSDAFVAKLNPSGAALVFSTFLGSSGDDWGHRIAVDSAGNSYVAGATWSGSFPTVPPGAFDTSFNGAADGFIAKLNATGAALVYSTFLGGSDNDSVWGLAVDSAGNVFASGQTASADFPVTANAIDSSFNGLSDAFLVKLNATGTALLFSSFLGGAGYDFATGLALHSSGNAYIAGFTFPISFPTTAGAYDVTWNGGFDVFLSKVGPFFLPSRVGIFRSSAYLTAEDVNGNLAWDPGIDRVGNFGIPSDILIFGDWDGSGTTKIGIFRPSAGLWALDMNGNLQWDPGIDKVGNFGQPGDVPIVGDWTGDGKTKVGIFRAGFWALDLNGNLAWDPGVDKIGFYGQPSDTPIIGDWTGDHKAKVGIFRGGFWALDVNGNIAWDPGVDQIGFIGQAGDVPLLGDWNGDGRTKVGVYRASAAMFGLDYNGTLSWEAGTDRAGNFGIVGDTPIVGDWDGSGVTRAGIYRSSGGFWALDINGNLAWDPGVDRTGNFGVPDDQPVVGRW